MANGGTQIIGSFHFILSVESILGHSIALLEVELTVFSVAICQRGCHEGTVTYLVDQVGRQLFVATRLDQAFSVHQQYIGIADVIVGPIRVQ